MMNELLALTSLSLAFGRVNRATFHPDGCTPESDTDHTVMLALVAPALAARMRPDLSPERIAAFAVVHDLLEVKTGDVNTIGLSADGHAAKRAKERAALEQLRVELAAFPWIVATLDAYEAQAALEARWVRYVDKVLPKLTHALNKGATLRKMGKTRDEISEIDRAQGASLRDEYPEFPEVAELFDAAHRLAVAAYPADMGVNRPGPNAGSWMVDGVAWSTNGAVTVRTELGPFPAPKDGDWPWLRAHDVRDFEQTHRKLVAAAVDIPGDNPIPIHVSYSRMVSAGDRVRQSMFNDTRIAIVYLRDSVVAMIAPVKISTDPFDAEQSASQRAWVGPEGLRPPPEGGRA